MHAEEVLESIDETSPLRALIDGDVMAQTDEWREVPLDRWRALLKPIDTAQTERQIGG
jgi:hypothetical protein